MRAAVRMGFLARGAKVSPHAPDEPTSVTADEPAAGEPAAGAPAATAPAAPAGGHSPAPAAAGSSHLLPGVTIDASRDVAPQLRKALHSHPSQ